MAAAAAVLACSAAPAAAAEPPAGAIGNVEFVKNLPEMRWATAINFIRYGEQDVTFATGRFGLRSIDISDPENPVFLDSVENEALRLQGDPPVDTTEDADGISTYWQNEDMDVDADRGLVFGRGRAAGLRRRRPVLHRIAPGLVRRRGLALDAGRAVPAQARRDVEPAQAGGHARKRHDLLLRALLRCAGRDPRVLLVRPGHALRRRDEPAQAAAGGVLPARRRSRVGALLPQRLRVRGRPLAASTS